MCVSTHACMCTHEYSVQGQKMASDPPGTEVPGTCHLPVMGAGNQTQVGRTMWAVNR